MQNLHSFFLATREALIEVPPGELSLHIEFIHLIAKLLAELTHRHETFAFFSIRAANIGYGVTQKICHTDARNRHGILKCEKHPEPRSFVCVELVELRPVDLNAATRDCIFRVTGEGVSERAFTGTVWSHQCVDFPLVDLKVDSFENRSFLDRDVQVSDLENGHSLPEFLKLPPPHNPYWESNWRPVWGARK